MAETYDLSLDEEPTVMWRMRRRHNLSAHAVIGIRGRGAWVMWFLNDKPVGVKDFDSWSGALRWCELMKVQNWAVGWRITSELDDVPPPESPRS
jgi:hypothetical protein